MRVEMVRKEETNKPYRERKGEEKGRGMRGMGKEINKEINNKDTQICAGSLSFSSNSQSSSPSNSSQPFPFLPSISSKSYSSISSKRHERCLLQPHIHTALLTKPIGNGRDGEKSKEKWRCLPPMCHRRGERGGWGKQERRYPHPSLPHPSHPSLPSLPLHLSPQHTLYPSRLVKDPLSVNGVEKAVTKRIISRKCSRHVSSLHLQSRFPVHSPHRHSTDSPSSSTSSASSTFLPIKQPFVSSLSPPSPCSASAQTDENFDVFVNETIAGLADRAIGDAIANLRIEFLEGLLMKGNECHKRTTMSLKSELEKRKQELSTAERKIDDLERSHQAALDTCQRLTIRAIRNLEALEKTRRRVRSIATGEVHSIRDDGRIELMNTEINKDFLPWLIGKAESTYRHQSANSIANSKQTYHSFKV